MFCRNCGYEQDSGRFCDRCGQPIYKPRDDGNAPSVGGYDSYYSGSNDDYSSYDSQNGFYDEPAAADRYDEGYYRDSYDNNSYNNNYDNSYNDSAYDNYYDNSYRDAAYSDSDYYRDSSDSYYDDGYGYSDNAPRYSAYRSDGSKVLTAERKSNLMIILICIGICAVGIFLIWTVFKLITGKDTNGGGSYVTTTPAITTTTFKPATTPAPVETTTPKEKPAPKKAEVIPAASLVGMDVSDILDTVGSDYRVSWNEYERSDGSYICGITSDSCFPGVLISYPDEDFGDEEELLELFESGENEGVIIYAVDGAVIGDGLKIGDKYSDMISKANCLGAVDPANDTSISIISGKLCYLQFEGDDDLYAIAQKYGSEVADATGTDYKCSLAIFSDDFSFGESAEATVTANVVALRVAPYAASADMWNIDSGEKIKVSKKDGIIQSDNSTWYRVYEYRPENGVWKHGYIHAEYVRLD